MALPPDVTKPRAHVAHEGGGRVDIVASSSAGVVVVPLRLGASARLGRAPDCDVVIDDDSVSRYHASIRAGADGALTVEDTGSMNGVFVGGARLAPGQRAELAVGAPCFVGSTTVYVLVPGAAAAPEAARVAAPSAPGRIVREPAMQQIYALLDVFAPSPLSVLILGETGVGKEVFAEAIHQRSPRAAKPFLKLNCAALADSILEAELFGHEKGAFTGATQAKAGLFESAHGGTVMLDEVGDLPAATQTKLLRFLESGEVLRLGSVKPIVVDVRIVAATHVDLRTRIEQGGFRADLYFRLDGISVTIPPLRERPADIEPLVQLFATRVAARLGRTPPSVSARAKELLVGYDWPGNVRELRNVVERAVVLSAGGRELLPEHLASIAAPRRPSVPSAVTPAPAARSSAPNLKDELERLERERIIKTLDEAAGNQTRAAKILGISRHALLDRLDRYGITRPRKNR